MVRRPNGQRSRRGISQADHVPRTTGRATVYGQTSGRSALYHVVITFQQLTTSDCTRIGKISVTTCQPLFRVALDADRPIR